MFSIFLMPRGFQISKTLNNTKPAIKLNKLTGRKNNAIQIHQAVPSEHHLLIGECQHVSRIAVLVFLLGVGEQLPDVPERGSSQQCIGDRMQQNIGVRVTDKMLVNHLHMPDFTPLSVNEKRMMILAP